VTGNAGRKNWEVKGTRRRPMWTMGMRSLIGKPGTRIITSQNAELKIWMR
jgi:hypothetical protein